MAAADHRPFLDLVRDFVSQGRPEAARAIVRRRIHLAGPALIVIALAVASFGFNPIADSLKRTVQRRLLSGDALNFNWLVNWFLEVFHADTYGPATDGAVLIVAISNFNLIAFYGFTGSPLPFPPVVGLDLSIIFSAVNLVLFLLFWADLVLRGRSTSKDVPVWPEQVYAN